MKLKKYNMAIYYFSKAVKFLEKSNDKFVSNGQGGAQSMTNPNEHLCNLSTQKSYEIIFNYGLALYKSGKYYEAFKCFEKVSLGVCNNNPKLWYYMSLCTLKINKEMYQKNNTSQSDLYHTKIGYSLPHYVRQSQNQKHKRFEIVPKGDQMSVMEGLMQDFELNKLEESKRSFLEAHKKFNHDNL